MKKFFLFFILCGFIISASGQNSSQKWGLGVYAGDSEYNGDLGNGFFKLYPTYRMGGFFLGRYLNPSFDIALHGDYGSFGFDDNENSWFLVKKTNADLLLKFKLNNGSILKEDAVFAPFIALGGGIAAFSDYKSQGSGTDFLVPVGAGLRFSPDPNDMVDFQYQILFNLNLTNKGDLPAAGDKLSFITHSFGIVFNFGSPRDSDKDGVPDKIDKCPGTPQGVNVDSEGCPLDSDGDGIPDHLDKCPDKAGLEIFNGCPDTDGDGIQDSEDKCPTVKGPAALGGCPDSDGDGIIDQDDKCPTVKGLAQFNGCPDTDGDGIIDSEDRCPTVKGLKEFAGCPDTDGDGIPDIDDRCPTVPGIKENKGCPQVAEETVKVFTQALTGILFETGKDVIRPVSFSILDNVVRIMKENPAYLLDINGHTDNVGDDAMNLDLSERRAASVKRYLVEKGVEENRLTSKGYGETMPIADNSTAAGRAKNRRVEFKVNF